MSFLPRMAAMCCMQKREGGGGRGQGKCCERKGGEERERRGEQESQRWPIGNLTSTSKQMCLNFHSSSADSTPTSGVMDEGVQQLEPGE